MQKGFGFFTYSFVAVFTPGGQDEIWFHPGREFILLYQTLCEEGVVKHLKKLSVVAFIQDANLPPAGSK